ncbi:hypothetical protein BO443_40440 [Burkholderia orbicola]
MLLELARCDCLSYLRDRALEYGNYDSGSTCAGHLTHTLRTVALDASDPVFLPASADNHCPDSTSVHLRLTGPPTNP